MRHNGMKFTGTVKKSHFSQFYGLMVAVNASWTFIEDHPNGVFFDIDVPEQNVSEFKTEICRLLPCAELTEKKLTLFQRLKKFLTKGDNCDQCC